jgi:hypothetical protein
MTWWMVPACAEDDVHPPYPDVEGMVRETLENGCAAPSTAPGYNGAKAADYPSVLALMWAVTGLPRHWTIIWAVNGIGWERRLSNVDAGSISRPPDGRCVTPRTTARAAGGRAR